MLNLNGNDKKVDTGRLNEILSTGSKIFKLLYVLFIIVLVYVIGLIFKEWKVLPFFGKILSTISPLFIGFFIAWLLNPLVLKLNKKGVKKTLSVIIVYLLLLLLIYLIFAFTIPSLGNQISDIVAAIPGIVDDVNSWINKVFVDLSNMTLQNLDAVKASFLKTITDFAASVETNLPTTAVNLISSVASGIGTIVLSLIIGFYILFDYDKFTDGFIKIFPSKNRNEVMVLSSKLSDSLYAYVSGTLWLSLLLFILSVVGFSIIGLNASVLIAFICVITNLIPYIGPYMGAAVAAAIGFAESPIVGTLTLIFILIVQTIEGNFLHPLVMSKKMKLSPITIIISLLVFGYMWGIFGMVIATPLMAIIKILYEFFNEKYHFFEYKIEENK